MLYPMFAMVILTTIIGLIALKTRFASVSNGEVNPRYYKLMQGEAVTDGVVQTTRALNNQFEIPVLFYVACSLFITMGIESTAALYTAWAFVFFRYVHAAIHLSYNHVFHRLTAFWLAMICMLGLWVMLVLN